MEKNELLQAIAVITEKYREMMFDSSRIFVSHKYKETIFLVPVKRKTNQDLLSGLNNKEFADYCQLENGICVPENMAKTAGLLYKKFNSNVIFLLESI